ncbi:hypothetical protein EDC04DRAFT_2899357 [Pisolithus marmoratus]|nr:hypothetical protein EDC04DRAFT_2899357 [Pisolithus marmoratus]
MASSSDPLSIHRLQTLPTDKPTPPDARPTLNYATPSWTRVHPTPPPRQPLYTSTSPPPLHHADHAVTRSTRRVQLSPTFPARDPPLPSAEFSSRRLRRFSIYNSPDIEHAIIDPVACEESLFFCFPGPDPKAHIRKHAQRVRDFLTYTVPRQLYLHLMLRLPSLYFSRIARLFEDADVSQPDIDRLLRSCDASNRARDRRERMSPIPQTAHAHNHDLGLPFSDDWTAENVGPALVRFKTSWESFIDSLLREWKTLNLVSALLLSAILSMFQNTEMAYDPLTRTTALLSLTCALMSLSYGCVYIVRFATMKTMYKAGKMGTGNSENYNVYIMERVGHAGVALRVVGLVRVHTLFPRFPLSPTLRRSMIFFIASILSFVWRSGSTTDPSTPSPLDPTAAIGPRVLVSAFFLLGLIYFAAIVKTLQGYGRVSGATREAETAGETRDAIREETEMERRGERGRGRERRRGRVNDRAKDWKRTREDDGPESEPEPASRTYDHDRDDRASSSLDAVGGLGLRGLDGVASPRASDERERVRDIARDILYEESLEGEGKHHRDGSASV